MAGRILKIVRSITLLVLAFVAIGWSGPHRLCIAGVESAISGALGLTKQCLGDQPVRPDDEVTYVIAVCNNGGSVQEQVVVTDTVSAGLSLIPGSVESNAGVISVDGNVITMTVAELASREIAVLNFSVTVLYDALGQTITNTAVARSADCDPLARSAVLQVVGDSDADGILDDEEQVCTFGVGSGYPCDSDGDSISDYQDTDSDADGILDVVEGNGDTDDDNIPNYRDTDADGDGIPDSIEAGEGAENPVDTDGDDTPDYQDTDSDADGILDVVEGNGDTDDDNIPNYRDTDADGDGIPDSIEAGEGAENPVDTDGDDTPDYQDTDSDGDGILDNEERVCTFGVGSGAPCDTDDDGTPDYQDTDSDADTILDEVERVCTPGIGSGDPCDSDGDGIPDYRDTDSDDDDRPDAEEGDIDANEDGIPDYRDGIRIIYLPLVIRRFPPPEYILDDVPDTCPGYSIVVGDLHHEDFDRSNDNDWYSFEATEGVTYTIQTFNLEDRADTMMRPYGSDCETQLAGNDDISWPHDVASLITWQATASDTYCVVVQSYDWAVHGEYTGYTFQVSVGSSAQATISAEGNAKPPSPPTPAPAPHRQAGKSCILLKPTSMPTPTAEPKPPPPVTPTPVPPTPTSKPSEPEPSSSSQSMPTPIPTATPTATATPTPSPILPVTGASQPAGLLLVSSIGVILLAAGYIVVRLRRR